MTSTHDVTAGTIVSRNPATGEVVGSVTIMEEAEVRQRVQRARRAQRSWWALGPNGRAAELTRVQDHLAGNARSIAERIAAETGKPRVDALTAEVMATCDLIRTLRRQAPRVLRRQRLSPGLLRTKRAWKVYEPYGVIGVISPWNFPFVLSMSPTVSALFAGNAVVLKPSEVTPLVGAIVEEAFAAAGAVPDIVTVVHGPGSTGAQLIAAGIDKVSFTGSTATGKRILAQTAERLVPTVLELGGKDPMIVCEDADIDRAARGAVWGAFSNAGQACVSVERVYVAAAVHDEFVAKVVEHTQALRQGVDTGAAPVEVGAMIGPAQADVVAGHIADAVDKGATVRAGGRRPAGLPGDFFAPTVLTGVDHGMQVMREETFGPVLPIMRVAGDEEAIQLANDTTYGLSGSVWSRSPRRARALAGRLTAGSVVLNDVLLAYALPAAPFGGVKASGFGRAHGAEGLHEYARVKSVVEDRAGLPREPFWFPYPRGAFEAAARVTGVLYRRSLLDRVRALFGR